MKLSTSLLVAVVAAIPALAADGGADKFGSEFLKHWATAKELAVAVADAMPEADYGLKPNPEEMSFGEQITHIALANGSYCARMQGGKSPLAKPETADKASIEKLLAQSFDYCTETIQGIKDFDAMQGPAGKQVSERELMLGVLTHMAHHRGQAEVYLRVKGIKPPSYKF